MVVIGGGITGALVVVRLAEAGVKPVVLDKRDIGTAAPIPKDAGAGCPVSFGTHEDSGEIDSSDAIEKQRRLLPAY